MLHVSKTVFTRVIILGAAVMLLSSVTAPHGAAADSMKLEPKPRLGINLAGPADWSTELPLVDVFHLSRRWVSQRKGALWGKGPALDLDEHGWVRRLEPDCWAETPLCTISGGHYPAGEYTVLYDGEGELDVWNTMGVISRSPGRMVVKVHPLRGGFHLKLVSTNPKNYVRNIRMIMPGFLKTYGDNPWHPDFLHRWQGVACLRFMDFMKTNNSTIRSWSQRPKLEDATFTSKGVPLELMIDLANRLKADPWFCMPHLADDEYVRNFAKMVRAHLHPSRKAYIEYSNELWNGMFRQSRWAGEEGKKLDFAEKPWEAGWRYTAYRSVQIFRIWEEVFGGTQRLVRVLASQAANPYVSERIVEFQDAYKYADALAIAPYISCNVPREGKRLNAAIVEKWTLEQALDYMDNSALPESIRWIQGSKEVADKYGLKLVAYEGGQHMVGVYGVENNEAITKLLHAANAHPRMGEIYRKYYDAWVKEGGDLFCHFLSVGRWSKWGCWGLLQFCDEDPAKSPKFMATMRWARGLGQPVNLPGR